MTSKNPTSSKPKHASPPEAEAVSPFVYRPAPGWQTAKDPEASSSGIALAMDPATPTGQYPESRATEENLHTREKESWERGFQEGIIRGRAESEAAVNHLRESVADTLREFIHERDAYFHHVEGEVVALALAVVRKILRREAQVDPLLLSGLVRVALEKMAASQTARLHVNPAQIPIWQDFFSHQIDLPLVPELLGQADLEHDQCKLETDLGASDLNLEMQLKEIEQGLFDLLAQRPAPR
jgi:flagellar assembly protein FliH